MNKNLKKLISTVAALAITATSAFSAFAANFTDVADTADYKVAVDNLVALGIVEGYDDGTYGPEKLITRAEASKMIVGTMGPAMMDAAEASMGTSNFTDVAGDHWASGYIAQGVSKGYINGVGNGLFDPNSNVTYAQIVKMLVSVLGYAEDAEANGGWPNGYINQGTSLEVTDGVSVASGDTAVNRGQVAMLINNALDVPIKGIEGYEQGFKMVDGQLVPTPVAVTEVYNGKGDSGKYETLLTTYFDAYAVRGRITNTESKAEGTIDYQIEFAENFDEEVGVYNGKKDDDGELINKETVEVYYPAGLDVDSLLCAYSDAIIMENEDGDWELVSIAPYGKNDVVEVASELYVDGSFDLSEGYIEFYQSKTSSKKDDYELDPSVDVYVNGIEITTDVEDTVKEYLADPTAEFKLVNTPKAGSKTIDSKVDYIMITSYITAVVDEVFVEEDKATIYLKDATAPIASIKLDLDAVAEGEADYSFTDKDGNEVSYEELVAFDVLTVYAPTTNPSDLEGRNGAQILFLNVVVTQDVVSGKITGEDDEDEIYVIGGEEYSFAGTYDTTLSIGDDYTFYLNSFGKIAMYEKTASAVNYGIINKVWENSNGDKVVRLVDANGSIVTYQFNKATDYTKWVEEYAKYSDPNGDGKTTDAMAFTDEYTETVTVEDEDGNTTTETIKVPVYEKMIVTYKVNASEKIYDIESVQYAEDGFDIVSDTEFTEKSQKVGKAKMSDLTKVVDYSEAKAIWTDSLSGTVASGTVSSFADGEKYTVVYGGSEYTDGTYPFVVVLDGVAKIGTASSFAVVKSAGSSVNEADGISYYSATILEGKDEKQIFFEEDVTLDKGDVIVYSVNGEGLVETEDFYVLYNGNDSIALEDVAEINAANEGVLYAWDASMPWAEEKYGDDDKQAQLGYGVLVDKNSNEISVGIVEDGVTKTFEDFDVTADANIYVFDQGIGKGDKMSVGALANLVPTKIASQYSKDDIYDWNAAEVDEVNTVFFKTFEGDITDIIVILPQD